MKPSKLLLIVMRGSKRIREMAAEACGVKLDTIGGWVRDEDERLLDLRIHEIVTRETGLDKDALVEIQNSEKVA
jgi:hypothetical protein